MMRTRKLDSRSSRRGGQSPQMRSPPGKSPNHRPSSRSPQRPEFEAESSATNATTPYFPPTDYSANVVSSAGSGMSGHLHPDDLANRPETELASVDGPPSGEGHASVGDASSSPPSSSDGSEFAIVSRPPSGRDETGCRISMRERPAVDGFDGFYVDVGLRRRKGSPESSMVLPAPSPTAENDTTNPEAANVSANVATTSEENNYAVQGGEADVLYGGHVAAQDVADDAADASPSSAAVATSVLSSAISLELARHGGQSSPVLANVEPGRDFTVIGLAQVLELELLQMPHSPGSQFDWIGTRVQRRLVFPKTFVLLKVLAPSGEVVEITARVVKWYKGDILLSQRAADKLWWRAAGGTIGAGGGVA